MPGDSRKIIINGRFLAQRLSGVQRYARELVKALDRLIVEDAAGLGTWRWQLAVPPGVACDLPLTAISTRPVGRLTGHAWEQIDLLRAARGARLVNLGNSGPILHRRSFVVIHDAAPYRTPDNFSPRYGAFHRMLGRILARTSTIGTVSQFSRGELADVLRLDPARIFVANNGCDHLLGQARSTDIVARLGLIPRRYFLFVGSPTPNKNLGVALEAFRRLGRDDTRFVVAGALNSGVFGGVSPESVPGVIVASGLTDPDVAGLYAQAAAHVFPTRYEGFGIPPLEAMTLGCPVLASDIPVTREVCGEAASYFAPDDAEALRDLLSRHLDAGDHFRASAAAVQMGRYSWKGAASSLADAVAGYH